MVVADNRSFQSPVQWDYCCFTLLCIPCCVNRIAKFGLRRPAGVHQEVVLSTPALTKPEPYQTSGGSFGFLWERGEAFGRKSALYR